ncbi:hypothetical protein DAPK24_009790 [Pichia kluyveri]|uniref:Uncharacterized protein n=1 Tax=Pichia kluyveri TaxID=36015 RepID=A0AAV5R179_PICKL|nr:hypothetical protein DAPK24_009790 [Pichia kluyveri]
MDQSDVYRAFESFDFDKCANYGPTLTAVREQHAQQLDERGEKPTPEDDEQLILQTKAYIFCTETDNILELSDYAQWKLQEEESKVTNSYEEVVEMILQNKPVPGIQQIPTTLHDESEASETKLSARPKPWESKDN